LGEHGRGGPLDVFGERVEQLLLGSGPTVCVVVVPVQFVADGVDRPISPAVIFVSILVHTEVNTAGGRRSRRPLSRELVSKE